MNDLPGARREANYVADMLKCDSLIGYKATRANVIDALQMREFHIIHYAGHGYYGMDGLNGIVLADGNLLTSDDVKSLRIRANLFNLVSCWNGMTEFSTWNELDGFVGALLGNGSRYVVSSAYPVADDAMESFTSLFYRWFFVAGLTPCESFRKSVEALAGMTEETNWGGLYIAGQRHFIES